MVGQEAVLVMLREAGQLGEAAQVYEDVISQVTKDQDLDPDMREDYSTRYRYELSNLYVEMNKIDKASFTATYGRQ